MFVIVTNHAIAVIGAFATMQLALEYARRNLIGYAWDVRPLTIPVTLKRRS